jgi:hypothetical protein
LSLSRSPIALAALAVASMSGLGLSAEVVPRTPFEQPLDRPQGLGSWVRRKNRVRRVKAPNKRASQLNQRLAPATGPGSYHEWKQHLAAQRAAKRAAVTA